MKKSLSILICVVMFLSLLTGCTPTAQQSISNTYEVEVEGHNGPIKLAVEIGEEIIKSITIVDHSETAGISDGAIEKIPAAIVESQSLSIDVVAGATVSSKAIISGVEKAIAQAKLDIEKFKEPIEKAALIQGETEETDIVIVGAGISGIMGAMELQKNYPDLDFIILEKLPVIGGSIVTTGGAIFGIDSRSHKDNGIVTNMDDVISYLESSSNTNLNRDLIANVFSLSGETIDWLVDLGLPLEEELKLASPHNDNMYAAWTVGGGKAFYDFLEKAIPSQEFDLRTESKVTELVVEGNVVKGVIVQDKEKEYKILADKVILSTGGFGSNPELMKKFAPAYAEGVISTHAGATGDGILLTEQFNTAIVGDGTMGTAVAPDKSKLITSTFMINKDGHRFHNEVDALYRIQRAIVDNAGGESYVIADGNYADKEIIEKAITDGVVKKFSSLEELADDIGINKENLIKEVKAYNKAIEAGISPGYNLPGEKAIPIKDAPFYVSSAVRRTFGTIPGIKITGNCEVVNGDNTPITNLYAAGELTAGNAFSRQYPGAGIGISYAANSGRYAARQAALSIIK